MSIGRLHLGTTLFLGALIVGVAGCRAPAGNAQRGGSGGVHRDLAALQKMERTPVACTSDGDCAAGSHCDDAAGRCAWSCLADSDCHDGESCDAGGRCVRGAHVTTFQAVTSPSCATMPVSDRLAALAGLTDNPLTCFGDDECPCGSYCGDDATCHYDCLVDNATSPPFCDPGLSCSPEGRCLQPSQANDPTYIVDLQLAPAVLRANTATAAVVVPAQVSIRAKQQSFVAGAGNVTVSLSFAEAKKTATAPALMPRVRCAPSAALAASCDLSGGWIMGTPSDPLSSQPRTIWVELPQDTNADSWGLTARSQWSDTIATVPVLAQPVVTPPHQTGHFAGTLSWPQAGGDPLVLPVDAYVTATRVALVDPSRVLLPDGPAVLSRDTTQTTGVTWLWTEVPSPLATVNLDLDQWSFDAAHERITAGVNLSTANGPGKTLLTVSMSYAGPPTASCTTTSACGAGSYCNTEIGLCLPGTRANSMIFADGASPPAITVNPPALLKTWQPALNALRAAPNTLLLGGDDVIGLERVTCFDDPAQTTAGWLGSSNADAQGALNPSLDLSCGDGKRQQMFPYADQTQAVTVDAQGIQTFSLLDSCVADLNVTPTQPFTPANLLGTSPCVSLARFLLAKTTTSPSTTNYPQVARRRMENQVTREWLTLHALMARTAAQENEYDAIAGVDDEPASTRLGNYVDLIERDWRLVVRPKRTLDADAAAAQQPDYRTLARPVASWSFNTHLDGPVADDENGLVMRFANMPNPDDDQIQVKPTGWNFHGHIIDGAGCSTDSASISLPTRHFSVVGWMGETGAGNNYTVFEKDGASDFFRVRLSDLSTAQRTVEVSDSRGGVVNFTVDANFAYWAFVEDGGVFKLYAFVHDFATNTYVEHDYLPTSKLGAGPEWGQPGRIWLGCNPPAGMAIIDDLSLWDKPLAPEELRSFAAHKNNDSTLTSVPPAQITRNPTDEQENGLAVHLVDAAAAQMTLLSAYVQSEDAALFNECGNAAGPAHARVLGRVGRGLRFAALLENDAADLVALAGATSQPWIARYNSTLKLLAGKRAEVVHALASASSCDNPLGISESDLPLYQGEAVGDSDKFFASSRWLSSQAHAQIAEAKSELELARSAWEEARVSLFQDKVLGPAEAAERVHQLQSQYESEIRRYCGAPATGTIMDGLANHTLTTASCFIKLDDPSCAGADQLPIKSVPASCLRGEIGEQILAAQAADLDERNAESAYDRAIAQYDADMEYCTDRSDFNQATEALQQAHRAHMIELRGARESDGLLGSFVKDIVLIGAGAAAGQPTLAIAGATDMLGTTTSAAEKHDSDVEQDEESAFQLVLAARAHVLDNMGCFHDADNQKFAIDAAHDVINRAYQSSKSAMLHLQNLQDEVSALAKQAAGDIEVEQNLPRVLPHHHYWLSDHIDNYRRHFRYAERLTYLALRAFEYESQQSIGYRNDVLTAQTLAILDQVTTILDQRNAPVQGEQGFVPGSFAPVMSLRDEILGLAAGNTPPGFPTVDATTALRNYLKSDAAKIYSGGQYLGRGIRFSLTPPAWAQYSCAERIWRVTSALQVQGSPINNAQMVLWQENSFGSQQCNVPAGTKKLQVASVQPYHNLLVDDGGSFDGSPFATPPRYTAMQIQGLGNKTRDDLMAMTDGLSSGFAGRGLYANYVLLFPSQQFDDPNLHFFDNVKDVLFRFDIVDATNVGDPNP